MPEALERLEATSGSVRARPGPGAAGTAVAQGSSVNLSMPSRAVLQRLPGYSTSTEDEQPCLCLLHNLARPGPTAEDDIRLHLAGKPDGVDDGLF